MIFQLQLLPWAVLFILVLPSTNAEQRNSFIWGLPDETDSRVVECKSTNVFVNPTYYTGVTAVPPFYMIAYPPNGIPSKSNVGNQIGQLRWTVPYSAGTRLLLGMVDGNSDSGGVATAIYVVSDGNTTSCHSSAPTTPLVLTVTKPETLSTCSFLSLRVQGGKKPYTITLAVTDRPLPINVTLGPDDDLYDYLNILKPGVQFVATASDADGFYSQCSDLITTSGSTDNSCPGLSSKPGKYVPPGPSSPSAFPPGAIAGIAVGGVVIALLIIATLYIRRKKRPQSDPNSALDLTAGLPPLSNGYNSNGYNYRSVPQADINPYVIPNTSTTPRSSTLIVPAPDNGYVKPRDATAPPQRIERASVAATAASTSQYILTPSTSQFSPPPSTSPDHTLSSTSRSVMVVQHADASEVLELPPAYRDDRQPISPPPDQLAGPRRKS